MKGAPGAESGAGLVSGTALAELLAGVAERTPDPRAGIFGPGSISWQVNRESALFLGAGRAALLQLAHPWVAASLAQHSDLLTNPIGRFHGTFRVIFAMIFGTRGQALAASQGLHRLHTGIRGELPAAVAGHPAGERYEANEIAALRWVFATLVESALVAYEFALPPLSENERERYYAESKTMAALFGIPPEALPEDWAAFARYNEEMWNSEVLGVDELARSMAASLLRGAGSWVRPPRWYRALTAASLPPRFREEFGLPLGAREARSLRWAAVWFPLLYRRMPGAMRFVGPYWVASVRVASSHVAPDRVTRGRVGRFAAWWNRKWNRASTRFWTGEPELLFPQLASE